MIEKSEVYEVEISGAYFDNLKAYAYEDFDPEDVAEEDLEEAYKDKAAANVKFNQMCMNLQKGLDDMLDIETEGGNHTTIPSKMSFKLVYTQPDGLVVEVDESEYAEDEEIFKTRDGRVFFKGTKAIKRLIGDALAHTYKVIANYWCPIVETSGSVHGVVLKEIEVEKDFDSASAAESVVTKCEKIVG
jgi:hypothetical protein